MKNVIYMQHNRPELCCQCNLCVERPANEIPPGSKFTHFCLLKQKELSRRGIHTEDKHGNYRCKVNEYRKHFCEWDGEHPISKEDVEKYKIDEMKMPL